MDALSGKNSTGRRVSLLNDGPDQPLQPTRLPSITPSLQSRTSSYASSPVASPPTPPLVRSHSSDSAFMQTPSPITPDFVFDHLPAPGMDSPVFSSSAFFAPQKEMHCAYPPVPLPYHPAHHHQHVSQSTYFHPQHVVDHHAAQQEPNNLRPKKNSYPCPMAAQFKCNDYFTTSGHAARHAKKHTGKKDAFCPECNKAFTRKDNMEQHRRTHQTGRSTAKPSERDLKKLKQNAKRPKPAPLQSSMPTLSSLSMVDPSLSTSPATSFLTSSLPPAESFLDFAQRSPYPDPTPYSMTHHYSTSASYGGLDALAMAASGEKRKFES